MGEQKFVAFCKQEVLEYMHLHGYTSATLDDIYVVWLCKILQNNKALLSTALPDGLYFEVTYNGDKSEFYVDAYKKADNYVVAI